MSRNRLAAGSVLLCLLALTATGALAQDAATGRAVTQDDWMARLPIVIAAIVLVLVVDFAFIIPVIRRRGKSSAGQPAE